MDYSTKKKNTDNYYQSKNLILQYDDSDDGCNEPMSDYNTSTIIGSYSGVQRHSLNEEDDIDDEQDTTENNNQNLYIQSSDDIYKPTCTFNDVKHLFNNFKIYHVNMNYYPFSSTYIEDTYKTFYNDIAETRKCPACNYYFDEKIYVIDRYIIICDTCFSNENIIKYI